MTITTEVDKCLKQENTPDSLKEPGFSGVTPKKIFKCLFGIFALFSVGCTAESLIWTIAREVTKSPAESRQYFAAGFLTVMGAFAVLYCLHRDAHATLIRKSVSQFVLIFSPTPYTPQIGRDGFTSLQTGNEFAAWTLSSYFQYLQFRIFARISQWCLMTLFIGPEITSNFLKPAHEFSQMDNNTVWFEAKRVQVMLLTQCIDWSKTILICTIALVAFYYCQIGDRKREKMTDTSEEKKLPSKLAWIIGRLYGKEGLDIGTNTLLFHCWFRVVSSFPIITGLITRDFAESLNIISSFFITLLMYLIFIACRIALDLFCLWVQQLRIGSRSMPIYHQKSELDV